MKPSERLNHTKSGERHPIRVHKPRWLRRRLPSGTAYEEVRHLIGQGHLHTVCQEARCPNQFECFAKHTATFLILGSTCTRNCAFCSVQKGDVPTGVVDWDEPARVARAAAKLGLTYIVVTSVTRDDLDDGGAGVFAATIDAVRRRIPHSRVEILIPDFQGDETSLARVVSAAPDVLNHNIETVRRLYPTVRPQADYDRSLQLLRRAHRMAPSLPLKSGLMLGLGETDAEIEQTLTDLYAAFCRILTIGQYLQPSRDQLPVERFVPPEEFDRWQRVARQIGFAEVASAPLVRSSYEAQELFQSQDNAGKQAGDRSGDRPAR